MALPSTFQERLHDMERTTDQRLSLLHAETDLQRRKSLLLSARRSSLRRAQQRCHLLRHRYAIVSTLILARKSQIESLDARFDELAEKHRAMRSETGEMEERKAKDDAFYEARSREMESFKEEVGKQVEDSRSEVGRLRDCVAELQATVKELQGSDGYESSSEIVEAERRKTELLAAKTRLDETLASNRRLRSLLQKQLHKQLGRSFINRYAASSGSVVLLI